MLTRHVADRKARHVLVVLALAGTLALVPALTTASGALAAWTPRESGTHELLWDISCPDATHCFVAGGGGTLLASTDGGESWSAQDIGTTENFVSVSFSDPLNGHAVSLNLHGGVYATTDGGASWTRQPTPAVRFTNDVECPDASTCHVASGLGWMLSTRDGGASWTSRVIVPQPEHQPLWNAISCLDADRCTMVGLRGAIVMTTDGFETWTPVGFEAARKVDGAPAHLWSVVMVDADTVIATGEQGLVLRTDDGGTTWSRTVTGSPMSLFGVDAFDASTVTAAGGLPIGPPGTVLEARDGATWMPTAAPAAQDLYGVAHLDAESVLVVGRDGMILKREPVALPGL